MKIDFSSYKNDTTRKKSAREICNKIIYDAFVNAFGEENVLITPCAITTENGVEFSAGVVIACIGQTIDKNGATVDVVIESTAKVKSWNNTGTKRQIKAVNFYDIVDAIDATKSEDETKKS